MSISTENPLVIQVINPKSGDGTAPSFVSTHVTPLLVEHGINIDVSIVSKAPGDAGLRVSQILAERTEFNSIILIVAGGDGTLHEIVNSLISSHTEDNRYVEVNSVIVPTGTANALYASLCTSNTQDYDTVEGKLRSLRAFLGTQSENSRARLTIAQSSIFPPPLSQSDGIADPTTTIYSIVVSSTCLHASILHDSESLREKYPDIQRFKVAAEKNITRWYPGQVTFRAPYGELVSIYDQKSRQFIPFVGDNDGFDVVLSGPFAYFLATINVDRLEPQFVISPLQKRIKPIKDTMDVIVIRPRRDPTISQNSDSKEDRTRFAEKTMQILHAAYKNGAHVDLGYVKGGDLHDCSTSDYVCSVVEYVRCASWEWVVVCQKIPWSEEEILMSPFFIQEKETAFFCADGTILEVEVGGKIICSTAQFKNLHFQVVV